MNGSDTQQRERENEMEAAIVILALSILFGAHMLLVGGR